MNDTLCAPKRAAQTITVRLVDEIEIPISDIEYEITPFHKATWEHPAEGGDVNLLRVWGYFRSGMGPVDLLDLRIVDEESLIESIREYEDGQR